jgi:23S rRNA (guanosine2251-2'-O)-methyltransferase
LKSGNSKSSMIIGRKPVIEAIQAGKTIERVFIQKNASGEVIDEIHALSREYGFPVNYVPIEKLNSFTRTTHQGVIAFTSAVQYFELQDVISFVIDKGDTPLFLLLDGITDVRNIGAIARSAVCCGAQAIIIPDKGVAPLLEDAMKSSAGALEKIMICRTGSLMKAVDELRLNGIQVLASEMKAPKMLHECDWTVPVALVMGSEEKGVYPALMKICDGSFKIPMTGDFESLNVSVAAGIILYEAMKQRMAVS